MIGYYGVDTLSKATTGNQMSPSIASLMLNNEDTLNLSFKLVKSTNLENVLDYSVDIYDKMTKNVEINKK